MGPLLLVAILIGGTPIVFCETLGIYLGCAVVSALSGCLGQCTSLVGVLSGRIQFERPVKEYVLTSSPTVNYSVPHEVNT